MAAIVLRSVPATLLTFLNMWVKEPVVSSRSQMSWKPESDNVRVSPGSAGDREVGGTLRETINGFEAAGH